jgi:predicted DNA-binding transcriptional regulator AlpA
MTPDGTTNWISRKELAKHWGVKTMTIANWVRRGILPNPTMMGKNMLWPLSVKDHFLHSGVRDRPSESPGQSIAPRPHAVH